MQIGTIILFKTPSVSINWSRSQHETLNHKDSILIGFQRYTTEQYVKYIIQGDPFKCLFCCLVLFRRI